MLPAGYKSALGGGGARSPEGLGLGTKKKKKAGGMACLTLSAAKKKRAAGGGLGGLGGGLGGGVGGGGLRELSLREQLHRADIDVVAGAAAQVLHEQAGVVVAPVVQNPLEHVDVAGGQLLEKRPRDGLRAGDVREVGRRPRRDVGPVHARADEVRVVL